MEKSKRFFYQSEMQRLHGELLLQVDSSKHEEQAESLFQQALQTARELQARSLELRAATSLGRLRQQRGDPTAHQLPARIYDAFTEGFATLDLQQARILIYERHPDTKRKASTGARPEQRKSPKKPGVTGTQ